MNGRLRRAAATLVAGVLLGAGSGGLGAGAGPPAAVAPGADGWPDGAEVRDLTFAGSGCLSNGSLVVPATSTSTLRIVRSRYRAEAGLVTDPHDGAQSWVPVAATSCEITGRLTFPSGWRVALDYAHVWGLVDLAATATARTDLRVDVADLPEPYQETFRAVGPLTDSHNARHTVATPHFSPCGATAAPFLVHKRSTVAANQAPRDSRSEWRDYPSFDDQLRLRWARC